MKGHLGYFHFAIAMNKASVSAHEQVFVRMWIYNSLRDTPRGGIAVILCLTF